MLNNCYYVATKKFLTKFPQNFEGTRLSGQKIQASQYHTLAFLNGKHYLDSKVTRIRIRTY